MTHTEPKILVGLIGAGIQQSLSPAMHEAEARHHGLNLLYRLIDLDVLRCGAEALPRLLESARQMSFAGLNITFPCKQAVIPLLDKLSPEASAIGAVNTVIFGTDGRTIGHNTDSPGWRWALQHSLPHADLSRVVLLGCGGAGAAIADALVRLGAQHLILIDSEPQRAAELCARLNARHDVASGTRAEATQDLAAALRNASGLVHATPIGMDKMPGTALPPELLHKGLWITDAVYFPIETQLLKAARACGCATLDGGGMAAGQAAGAFRLFTGREPDVTRMYQHVRQALQARE